MQYRGRSLAILPHVLIGALLILAYLPVCQYSWPLGLQVGLALCAVAFYQLLQTRNEWALYLIVIVLLACVSAYSDFLLYRFNGNEFLRYWMQQLLLLCSFTTGMLLVVKVKNEQDCQNLVSKLAIKEQALMRSQVNPHFLYNTLNAIYASALEQQPDTPELILKLSHLTRYQVESLRQEWVYLEEEIEFIENFITFERLRAGKKCSVKFDVNGNIDGIRIIPMAFINLIENAFKYGVLSTNEESHVEIILRVTQKEIRLQVINSIPENRLPHKPSTGTGLANLQERLQYSYPLRHYLTNSKTKTTYKVELYIRIAS
jgi:LytS/YehU family sensor histidine kinase